jgi:hypothetical protein
MLNSLTIQSDLTKGCQIKTNAPNLEHFYICHSTWLERRFVERELFNKTPNEANIERLRDLLEDEQ